MSFSVLLRAAALRALLAVASLLVVSAITFWCVEELPGDTAERMLGRDATAESLALLREKLGLGAPAHERYLRWLGGVLQGDFGRSLSSGRDVLAAIALPAGNTLTLALFALAIYVPLSLVVGIVAAVKRGTWIDGTLSLLVLLLMCIPDFVIGMLLVATFAVGLGWFPPLALVDQAQSPWDLMTILFLPAVTLAAAMTAYAVRMMRDNLVEVLESPYVRLATLKGLSRRRVILRHALPNALGPAINVTALNIAWLIGGIAVVETVFNFPGLGRLLIDAIAAKDTPVIQAVVLLLTALYVLVNLIADLVVLALNPRLTHAT